MDNFSKSFHITLLIRKMSAIEQDKKRRYELILARILGVNIAAVTLCGCFYVTAVPQHTATHLRRLATAAFCNQLHINML